MFDNNEQDKKLNKKMDREIVRNRHSIEDKCKNKCERKFTEWQSTSYYRHFELRDK